MLQSKELVKARGKYRMEMLSMRTLPKKKLIKLTTRLIKKKRMLKA